MAYVTGNPKTKKALKDAASRGEQVKVFQPGGMFPPVTDGVAYIEGPHYPEPHRWYAEVKVRDGIVVSVK